jgi:hypothetical protein
MSDQRDMGSTPARQLLDDGFAGVVSDPTPAATRATETGAPELRTELVNSSLSVLRFMAAAVRRQRFVPPTTGDLVEWRELLKAHLESMPPATRAWIRNIESFREEMAARWLDMDPAQSARQQADWSAQLHAFRDRHPELGVAAIGAHRLPPSEEILGRARRPRGIGSAYTDAAEYDRRKIAVAALEDPVRAEKLAKQLDHNRIDQVQEDQRRITS